MNKNKLTAGSITLLVFSLLFVTSTLILFIVSSHFCFWSLYALYGSADNSLENVLGGFFLLIVFIPYAIVTIASACCILPFNLVMRHKYQIKTWYTTAILIFAIAAAATMFLMIFALPFVSSFGPTARSSSSSLSSISSF